MNAERDPSLDALRLASDPAYYTERQAFYARDPRWRWYVVIHRHVCSICRRMFEHTGLDATRDEPASHQCCGKDVRQ